MAARLPRIAADLLDRNRIATWLEANARTAVRFICAPAGSGKTSCAVVYARGRPGRVGFVTLTPEAGVPELIAGIALSLGSCGAASYAELVEQVTRSAPAEIIIDNVDNATPAARSLLARIYRDVPSDVTFLYLARTQQAVALLDGLAQGLVAICDSALLAFDTTETGRLVAALGVQADTLAAARLCEATHGWAIAVAGACRTAAANGLGLAAALRSWCRAAEDAVRELIDDSCRRASPQAAAAFGVLVAGQTDRGSNVTMLAAAAAAGLFVIERNGGLALNPLLESGVGATPGTLTLGVRLRPAIIEMFGRFEMSIDGRPIEWIRRRDRQIVAFLATRPRGRATRAEIVAAFWPEADRQLAGQSLRTACSTIRRAIAARVGHANVATYFVAADVVELVLENAVISSHQFTAHYDLAARAFERRDYANSFTHLRIAQQLYRSPLLAGEPPTGWALAHERRFALMRGEITARLAELSSGRWRADAGFANAHGGEADLAKISA